MTTKLKIPLIALGWVVAIVAVVQFVVGHLYALQAVQAHPAEIAIWLVFGVVLTAAGRAAPWSAVLTAATVLTVVAVLGQLGLADRPGPTNFGPWYASYLAWSSSYFTWIAVGVLFAQGLWGLRVTHRGEDERADGEDRSVSLPESGGRQAR